MSEQLNTSGKSLTGADVAGGGAGANAPSPVAVTQADRDAVNAFHRLVYAKIWHDIKHGTNKLDPKGGDTDDLVQAFARHREAERERCARVANDLYVELVNPAKDRLVMGAKAIALHIAAKIRNRGQ